MVCWCGALEGACGLVCGVESRVRFFFFFSSRRRHTRLTCDWSSDVCSSDLSGPGCRCPRCRRAGCRSLEQSYGILLVGNEDIDIQDHFISTAFPDRERAEEVIGLLSSQAEPMKLQAILAKVNIRSSRLEAMLKILEVEGAVERAPGGGWLRTVQPWSYDSERVEQVTAARKAEQAAMFEYIGTTGCLMAFLRGQLDDESAAACGRCTSCTAQQWSADLDPGAVAKAGQYLRSSALTIEPRLRWMGGVPGLPSTIPADARLEAGRALAMYNDGG